ncbi:MAG: hypothetical protein HGA59_07870 [Chlorobiaceae bacterium]|jgi:hypothetical protein|nr:hypothetical protein [Chlorobiaceae bacterium]NTV17187.1 hypothetical protein [Chlorobiaceae bacterium]
MTSKKQINEPTIQSIVMDGHLEAAEALGALSAASVAATAALPVALSKCETESQMEKVIADRDRCMLAYINSQKKTLQQTGPLFERTAKELEIAAAEIKQKTQNLHNAVDAVNLMADITRLACSLALAFC